jgi:hypothetical protein
MTEGVFGADAAEGCEGPEGSSTSRCVILNSAGGIGRLVVWPTACIVKSKFRGLSCLVAR